MAPEEIAELLKTTFGPAILEGQMDSGHPHVLVEPTKWHEIALFLWSALLLFLIRTSNILFNNFNNLITVGKGLSCGQAMLKRCSALFSRMGLGIMQADSLDDFRIDSPLS